jgi:hypothetical protein
MRLVKTRNKGFLDINRGEVSDLAGIDVTRPWRRADPREPIDGTAVLGYLDRPVVDVIESGFDGNGIWSVVVPLGDHFDLSQSGSDLDINSGMYLAAFGGGVGWPTFLGNGEGFVIFYKKSTRTTEVMRVTGVSSTGTSVENNKLDLDPAPSADGVVGDYVRVVGVQGYDRRGLFVSSGFRMRLHQLSSYGSAPLITVPEASRTDRWRGVRISNSRFLCVSPRHAPRIIKLADPEPAIPILSSLANTTYTDSTKRITQTSLFTDYTFAVGDVCVIRSGAGVVAGSYVINSRIDNDTISLETSAGSDSTNDVGLHILRRSHFDDTLAGPPPPFGQVDPQLGPNLAAKMESADVGSIDAGTAAVRIRVIDLDTNAVSPFYQIGDDAGGTTITAVANQTVKITLRRYTNQANYYLALGSRGHLVQFWRKLSDGVGYFLEVEVPLDEIVEKRAASGIYQIALTLSDTDLAKKQLLLTSDVVKGVPPAAADVAVLGDTGIVLLAGKADTDQFVRPVIDGLTYEWPTIDNDNVVHFSRTDAFEPENFPPRLANQLVLSNVGDTFQRFVACGDDVLAIMQRGVYRLTSGGLLGVRRVAIAATGLGTPWPDSVIPVEKRALWVNAHNVYLYDVENLGTDRPPLMSIGRDITSWLKETADLEETIQSAFDERRRVVIVRRVKTDGTIQDWEYDYTTSMSGFVEDRTGVMYANSLNARSNIDGKAILHSVDETGAVLEIGKEQRSGDSHPYDGKTVQATTDGTYTITTESITKAGAFSADMLGDSVRFRSSTAGVDGQVRQIRQITSSGDEEEFFSAGAAQGMIVRMMTPTMGVVGYWNDVDDRFEVRVFELSDAGQITFSAPRVIRSSTSMFMDIAVSNSRDLWVIVMSTYLYAHVLERADGVLLESADSQLNSNAVSDSVSTVPIGDGKIAVGYSDTTDSDKAKLFACQKVGATIKKSLFNTTVETPGTAVKLIRAADDKCLITYQTTGSDWGVRVVTWDGLEPTIHAAQTTPGATGMADLVMLTSSTFLLFHTTASANGSVVLGTIASDNTISLGTPVEFTGSQLHEVSAALLTTGRVIVGHKTPTQYRAVCVTVSGSTITVHSELTISTKTGGGWLHVAALDDCHFLYAFMDWNDSNHGTMLSGVVYGSNNTVTMASFTQGPGDALVFDAVTGLAVGDEFMVGAVPFRCRFAPVRGDRQRNGKRLDGVSVWAKPAGRTMTTSKTLRLKAFRNLSETAEKLNLSDQTEVTVPIKAASEVDTVDEDLYAPLEVEGKAIELELSNEDADTGFELVNVAGNVLETGELTEDRSTTE